MTNHLTVTAQCLKMKDLPAYWRCTQHAIPWAGALSKVYMQMGLTSAHQVSSIRKNILKKH